MISVIREIRFGQAFDQGVQWNYRTERSKEDETSSKLIIIYKNHDEEPVEKSSENDG